MSIVKKVILKVRGRYTSNKHRIISPPPSKKGGKSSKIDSKEIKHHYNQESFFILMNKLSKHKQSSCYKHENPSGSEISGHTQKFL